MNRIIEDMKIEKVGDLISTEALQESAKTGMYSHCGFAISDYAGETGFSGEDLLNARIISGIISSDTGFSEEALEDLGNYLEKNHPDIVVFDFWYHWDKLGDLSRENIKKVEEVLEKRLALHDLESYSNRLAYCRTKPILMHASIIKDWGQESCVISARNARAAFQTLLAAPNHISDMIPVDTDLKSVEWDFAVDEEYHIHAKSKDLDIEISKLEIPKGRAGYSLGYYAEEM